MSVRRYCITCLSCASCESGDHMRTLAAVMCDVKDLRSKNTAYELVSSFTTTSRFTTFLVCFGAVLQNLARPFLLGRSLWCSSPFSISCRVRLDESERFPAKFTEPFAHGNTKYYPSFGTRKSFVLNPLVFQKLRTRHSVSNESVSLSSFSPLKSKSEKCLRNSRQTDGASLDPSSISDDCRLLSRRVSLVHRSPNRRSYFYFAIW